MLKPGKLYRAMSQLDFLYFKNPEDVSSMWIKTIFIGDILLFLYDYNVNGKPNMLNTFYYFLTKDSIICTLTEAQIKRLQIIKSA